MTISTATHFHMEYHVREVTFIFLFGLLQFLLLPLTYVRTETKLLYFSCIGFYSVAASSPEQLRVRLQPSNTKKAHAHTNCKLNYAYFNAFFMLLQFGSWQKSMSCNRRSANWCHTFRKDLWIRNDGAQMAMIYWVLIKSDHFLSTHKPKT